MNLHSFVEKQVDDIVAEWVEFARTLLPAARDLSDQALRDHARVLLLAVVFAMRSYEDDEDRRDKSRGSGPDTSPEVTRTASEHARQRFFQNFTLNQMVAEYRALRASVIRRWTAQLENAGPESLDQLIRFGEMMDQGLTSSIAWYSAKVEESRGLLLGALGHDLRNPLGVVHLSATYLLRSEGLNGPQTMAVSRILNATARMSKMVTDLLDFTQTSLGMRLPIAPSPTDMGSVCRQVVGELEALHPDRRIHLETTSDLAGTWDASRIEQMLSNLVTNAVLHGAPETPIALTVTGQARTVTVAVHNHGTPISTDTRKTLFQPLGQARVTHGDTRSGASGLRLGLYIAREIAVAHGGAIEVLSTENEGTTFSVCLPREPPAGAESR